MTTDTPPLDHECWWKKLAEGLSATLAGLDNDSADSALRQILRSEKARRREAERSIARLEAGHQRYRADLDLITADLGDLLEATGLGDYARPESPHDVMQQAIAKVRDHAARLTGPGERAARVRPAPRPAAR